MDKSYYRTIRFLATEVARFYTDAGDVKAVPGIHPATREALKNDSFVSFAEAIFGIPRERIVQNIISFASNYVPEREAA